MSDHTRENPEPKPSLADLEAERLLAALQN